MTKKQQGGQKSGGIKRSPELVVVGYFLARCGRQIEDKGTLPPNQLGTDQWNRAYTVFFAALGSGRTLGSFCNSLKNARDLFDSHLDTGRVGWRKAGAEREPASLTAESQRVFERWQPHSDDALWDVVRIYADTDAASISETVLNDALSELGPDEAIQARTEGGRKVILSTRTERNPRLREDAIRAHGHECLVCRFNFEEIYGEVGRGFVEVHHLIPIGDGDSNLRLTNPLTDLAVLCANCHRIVHRRRGIVLTVDELRRRVRLDGARAWVERLSKWTC